MKVLRFYFVLFGLFFLSNGVLKAQLHDDTATIPIQVTISPAAVLQTKVRYNITVECDIPQNLAIALHDVEASGGIIPAIGINPEIQSSGSSTREHTFQVQLSMGERVYLTCGYMDDTSAYQASDGGCIIGTDLEP